MALFARPIGRDIEILRDVRFYIVKRDTNINLFGPPSVGATSDWSEEPSGSERAFVMGCFLGPASVCQTEKNSVVQVKYTNRSSRKTAKNIATSQKGGDGKVCF